MRKDAKKYRRRRIQSRITRRSKIIGKIILRKKHIGRNIFGEEELPGKKDEEKKWT
jgi:hypothetical protein